MAANHHMSVIRQNRTCPNGVLSFRDDLCNRVADGLPLRIINPKPREIQQRLRPPMKLAELLSGGLQARRLAAMVNRSQRSKFLIVKLCRSAAAQIIGEPMPVQRPDQVVRDDCWTTRRHAFLLRSRRRKRG